LSPSGSTNSAADAPSGKDTEGHHIDDHVFNPSRNLRESTADVNAQGLFVDHNIVLTSENVPGASKNVFKDLIGLVVGQCWNWRFGSASQVQKRRKLMLSMIGILLVLVLDAQFVNKTIISITSIPPQASWRSREKFRRHFTLH